MASKHFDTSIKLTGGFGVSAQQPLDARTVCESIEDMNSIPNIQLYYGLKVYIESTGETYEYEDDKFNKCSIKLVKNDLESDDTDIGLSAAMGKELKQSIDNLVLDGGYYDESDVTNTEDTN